MRRPLQTLAPRWLLVLAASVLFLWPALINGGAFFATDSIAYIRGPDQALIKLFGPGAGTVWSVKSLGFGYHPGAAAPNPTTDARSPPMAGRSIYYGLLANLGARTGGFWLTLLVQALAAAAALDLLSRAFGWRRPVSYLLLAGAAAFLTPLAFFIDCVMPDVWASVALLTAAALAAGGDRLRRTDWGLALVLMSYAAMVHTTHILLLAVVVGAGLGFALLRRIWRLDHGAPLLTAGLASAALLTGVLSGAAFNFAVQKVYGQPPLQPPFLTARLVGGGRPGEAWLRAHCPVSGFRVCAYAHRLPLATDVFLWSADPVKSVFWTAPPMDRVALGQEQFRFATAVLKDNPFGVIGQGLADGVSQLVNTSLEDFNHKDSVRASMDGWMAGPDRVQWRTTRAYRQAWPIELMNRWEAGSLTLSLVALAIGLAASRNLRGRRPDEGRSRLMIGVSVVMVVYLANAAICGGLSDIFGRYQARITAPLILISLSGLFLLRRPSSNYK